MSIVGEKRVYSDACGIAAENVSNPFSFRASSHAFFDDLKENSCSIHKELVRCLSPNNWRLNRKSQVVQLCICKFSTSCHLNLEFYLSSNWKYENLRLFFWALQGHVCSTIDKGKVKKICCSYHSAVSSFQAKGIGIKFGFLP